MEQQATDPQTATEPQTAAVDYNAWLAEIAERESIAEVATRVLPATQRTVPARVSVGKVRKSKLVSQHREADYEISAEILIDGKLAGHAEDEGHGGGLQFFPASAVGARAERVLQAEAWVLAGRPSFFLGESLWNDLLEEHQTLTTLQHKVKGGKRTPCLKGAITSVRVPQNEHGFEFEALEWLEINRPLAWALANTEALKRDGITHAFNGTEWQAL